MEDLMLYYFKLIKSTFDSFRPLPTSMSWFTLEEPLYENTVPK